MPASFSSQLAWAEPSAFASGINESYWVLLHSSAATGYSGRYSFLGCHLAERIESGDFKTFEQRLARAPESEQWFGYLGYGLKDGLERLAPDQPGWPGLPHLQMLRFDTVFRFDHQEKTLQVNSNRPQATWPTPLPVPEIYPPGVSEIGSNMSRTEYLKKAATVIEHIHAGDLYQANLTRKFRGRFAGAPNPFHLFSRLCALSPAPYSAFLKLGEISILSSSPEQFLRIEANGDMTTRPIKGTAARSGDAAHDRQAREALKMNGKDRAENLMIVDLMRNDLARGAGAGSVRVESLFEVTTHATIHHMSSTVSGKKRENVSALDAVKYCFPPGSMTGAPKISAINLCSTLEMDARGVYSGAIGWFKGDGSCELSVAIRTLILKDDRFEFQVGGGIVADSTPEGELKELIDKARGICKALGIAPERLAEL